jgi:hypothetical protein
VIGGARLVLFSIVSTVTYTFAYFFNWALFRFYIATGEIRWLDQSRTDTSSISWYGWLAAATLTGAVVTIVTPRRLAQRIPADAAWLVPVLVIAATLLYEKRWFF